MNRSVPSLILSAAILAGGAACERRGATVYTAPKDGAERTPAGGASAPNAEAAMDVNAPSPAERPATPKLSWKLPAGWTETGPGQMTVASFAVVSDKGQATVAITPLPDLAGREATIVNMWREQAGAKPLEQAEAEAALTPVEVADGTGKLFEVNGTRDGKTNRIVTAMLNREDGTWFFKLAGDDAAVAGQKSAFIEFLKSVRFGEVAKLAQRAADSPASPPAAAPAPAKPASAPSAPPPELKAPEGWRPLTAGQMQVAKFAVPDQGEAKAEVAVSMFTSDTGGVVANITRWRRQMGLPEVPDAEVNAQAVPLDEKAAPGGVVAELQKDKRRMIGAIVPRDNGWWFYKLMGDEAAVAAARESFLNFAKSQPSS